MGLKEVECLRAFCAELSSDQPSPGGGSASAAAGAMSASLLEMVCGITGKSNKHSSDRAELDDLRKAMSRRRDILVSLAQEDARSYDALFEASKRRRAEASAVNEEAFQAALKRAAEVPLRTAEECCAALQQSVRIAEIQARAAASDTVVAVLVGDAAFHGAVENVEVNLKDTRDAEFVRKTRARLPELRETAMLAVESALSRLRGPR